MLPSWLSGRVSCPANPAEKELVEECFLLLQQRLGFNRLRDAKVIEPTPVFFPDRYDASLETAAHLFARVCEYVGVKTTSIDLRFWQDEGEIAPSLALGAIDSKGASGYYSQSDDAECVSINVKELRDPEGLISTMAQNWLTSCFLAGIGFRVIIRIWKP